MATDAIELLVEDHRQVRDLLQRLVETSNGAEKTRTDLLGRIERQLEVHTQLEEEIFYPAFKDHAGIDGAELYYEASEEHRAVEEMLLPDLKRTEPGTPEFAGRARVLKEMIEHHAQEEEDEMFAKARQIFSREQLAELGDRLATRRKELR